MNPDVNAQERRLGEILFGPGAALPPRRPAKDLLEGQAAKSKQGPALQPPALPQAPNLNPAMNPDVNAQERALDEMLFGPQQ